MKCVFNLREITFDSCFTVQHVYINHKVEWTTNKHRASVVQLTSGKLIRREAVILKQLFCDWSSPLPSSKLSNKVWSFFLYIPQNLLMRPNPFNSCPNFRSYGYNCVCVCPCVCTGERRAVFSFCQGGKGRAAVSSEGEITSKTSKDQKHRASVSGQMSIISQDQPESVNHTSHNPKILSQSWTAAEL